MHFFLSFIVCYLHLDCYSQIIPDTSITFYFKTDSFKLDSDQIKRLNDFSFVFHVIIAPIVSIIMGALGGAIAVLIWRLKKRKQTTI